MSDVIDHLRMEPSALRTLIERYERSVQRRASAARRSTRWSWHASDVVIAMTNGAGEVNRYVSYARNLSKGGAGLLVGGYVHAGTTLLVTFTTMDGETTTHGAVVRHCKHLDGRLHEIGVQFECEVDPHDYLDCGSEDSFGVETVELGDMRGTVVCFESCIADQKLIAHHLRSPGLAMHFARETAHGMELLDEGPDVVLVGESVGGVPAAEVVRMIRARGHGCPVFVMSLQVSSDLRRAVRDAGGSGVMLKPCDPARLRGVVAESLEGLTRLVEGDMIICDLDACEVEIDAVVAFTAALHQYAHELDGAARTGERQRVIRIGVAIRGSAQSYGYAPLGELAASVVDQLERFPTRRPATAGVLRLISACRLASMPEEAASA